jgi:phage terminase large subunit
LRGRPISGKRYVDHWIEAGFECATPIKNSGAGAAMMRIESVRRIFPRCWFNEKTTEAGRDALCYYHERRDENRNVGLGPERSWASHAADSFDYIALAYEEPPANNSSGFNRRRFPEPRRGSFWSA